MRQVQEMPDFPSDVQEAAARLSALRSASYTGRAVVEARDLALPLCSRR